MHRETGQVVTISLTWSDKVHIRLDWVGSCVIKCKLEVEAVRWAGNSHFARFALPLSRVSLLVFCFCYDNISDVSGRVKKGNVLFLYLKKVEKSVLNDCVGNWKMFCFLKVEQPAAKQYDAVLRIRKAVHISFLRIKRFIRNMHVLWRLFFNNSVYCILSNKWWDDEIK